MDEHVWVLAEYRVFGALQAVAQLGQQIYLILLVRLLWFSCEYKLNQLLQTFETAWLDSCVHTFLFESL